MCYFKLLLPAVLLIAGVSLLQADIIHVPGDYETIQAGIDAAATGDTVLVADGIYTGDGNRDIDFLGKAIVVMSENGAKSCVIDCEGSHSDQHRGFYFHSGENWTTVVQGFTIKNGYVWDGGGVYCNGSSPTIVGNTITENWADNGGGGINCYYCSPRIEGNTISTNTANQVGGIYGGGGILCLYSPAVIEGNTIMQNTSAGLPRSNGGGIYCDWSDSLIIRNNTITHNYATYFGGGIFATRSDAIIESNTITGNVCDVSGSTGGGVAVYNACNPTIRGNMIAWNRVTYQGGGIYCGLYANPIIESNTIGWNTAEVMGGGICAREYSHPTVVNTILWADSAGQGQELYFDLGGMITCTYSDVDGGCSGAGNIDSDPMFVLADKNDYRLFWESPCIDTGDPTLFDEDGTRSDMGAHYFNQNDFLTLYLTPDATEMWPGEPLGVTYTAINRWDSPESCWLLTQARRHGGSWLNLLGPDPYTLPANYTAQVHITHSTPHSIPTGVYEYQSLIGMPPGTLYDSDSFTFKVIE